MPLHQRIILLAMRTTVTLDDDVYEAAQAHAQATGQRLGRVLSDMARQALQPSGRRSKRSAKRGPPLASLLRGACGHPADSGLTDPKGA